VSDTRYTDMRESEVDSLRRAYLALRAKHKRTEKALRRAERLIAQLKRQIRPEPKAVPAVRKLRSVKAS